jgi:hypothetical protein
MLQGYEKRAALERCGEGLDEAVEDARADGETICHKIDDVPM